MNEDPRECSGPFTTGSVPENDPAREHKLAAHETAKTKFNPTTPREAEWYHPEGQACLGPMHGLAACPDGKGIPPWRANGQLEFDFAKEYRT